MEAAAGKGVNAVSQSAECLSCHMTLTGQSRNAGFLWTSPVGLEGSGACGAVGIEIEIGIGESRRPLSS